MGGHEQGAAEAPQDGRDAISLEQYAGITAALADAHPLDGVLDNEGLDEAAWKPVEIAWKARIATAGATSPLFQSFLEKRAVAEDWLARRVRPLDDELPAWTAFLQAFGAHASPFDLLAAAGLGLPDLARLQRRWALRLAADQELRREAAKLAAGGPRPVPALAVEPLVLKPFPWSPGPRKRADEALSPRDGGLDPALDALPLDRYAALRAELAERPADLVAIAARYGVTAEAFPSLDARWKEHLGADAVLTRDYQRLFSYQQARLRRPVASAIDAPRAPSVAAPFPLPLSVAAPLSPSLDAPPFVPIAPPSMEAPARSARDRLAGTALALDLPRAAALPFVEGEAPASIREAPADPSPASRASRLAGTSLAVEVPRGPALPFPAEKPPAPSLPASSSSLAGTSLLLDVPRSVLLPFVEGAAPLSVREGSSDPPPPSRTSSLAGTSLALDIPRSAALPFPVEAPPAPSRPALSGTAPALDVPRGAPMPFVEGEAPAAFREASSEPAPASRASKLGGTAPAVEAPRGPELPFAVDEKSALPSAKARKLGVRMFELPAHLRGVGVSAPPKPAEPPSLPAPATPSLSIEQYASLCVELARTAAQRAEVLVRYRLTEAQHAEVERYFQERFAREPGARAGFEQACATYRDWLRSQGWG